MNYKWYKEGQSLLDEIKDTNLPEELISVWYIGQMGLVIKHRECILTIDPVLSDLTNSDGTSRRNYAPPFSGRNFGNVNYAICSHNHKDHLNIDTLMDLYHANPDIKYIVPYPEMSILTAAGIPAAAIIGAKEHQPLELFRNITLYPIASAHEEYITDSNGYQKNLGFIFNINGKKLYHSGDTVLTQQLMKDVRAYSPIDIACIPINGIDEERRQRGIIGNMDCRNAAYFSNQIQAELTIPLHYDMVQKNGENPLIFASYMQEMYPGAKYHILQLGERMLI